MNDTPANLFNALFKLHPPGGRIPKENFLSEAFAHVLMDCDGACDAWLSLALGRRVKAAKYDVMTRQTEHDDASAPVFPDMRISGALHDGERFDLYSEHKWDSPCNAGQIRTYLQVASRRGDHCRLAFIGAFHRQKKEAESVAVAMKGKAFLWADIFQTLESLPTKSNTLLQFLEFMKTHGLSPGKPINAATMVAFIQASGFEASLEHAANKLNDGFEWDFFPKRFLGERVVTKRWGRIAIEFSTPGWKPTITVGFLINEYDHEVFFVNPAKGIDLLFRIETAPANQKNISPMIAELRRKQKKLSNLASSVLLLGDRGNGNTHSLLMVRSCLGDVIASAKTQPEQLETIHKTLKSWGETLFADGALEKAFKQAGLDGGM